MIKYFRKNKIKLYFLIEVLSFIIGVIIGIFGECSVTSIQPEESQGAIAIFLNNIKVGISIFFLGAFSGGVYGIAILCINGYVVGELMQYLLSVHEANLVILGLLPHMGIEVFGLAFFSAIGSIPIVELVKWLRLRENYKKEEFIGMLKDILKGGIMGTLLLFIASLIEGYISCVK